MHTTVAVKSLSNDVNEYRRELVRLGLKKASDDRFTGSFITKKAVDRVRLFAARHRLKFYYDNEFGHRTSSYRQTYFRNHAPDTKSGKYYCVYCGKKLKKRDVTVDHLYPLNQASQDISIQKKMKKQGIRSVNAKENLVAACDSCNRKKSDRMGKWIRRGRLGNRPGVWKFRHAMRAVLVLLVIGGAVWAALTYVPGLKEHSVSIIRHLFQEAGIQG